MHKRILLVATGLTPQVVTETLYALATAPGAERFIPEEVHVITTLRGAELVKLLFMGEHANQLEALCGQWSIPMPRVLLHLLGNKDAALDDLRSAAENETAANSILEVVRALTRDDGTAVHFSIAGGRKTMGYYLGTCASILGRPQDRMSHVLVNEPFESAPEFFFPPNPPTHMLIRGRPTNSALARVALAPVDVYKRQVQCREDGRKIRHHRVVAAFVNFHVADASVEAISQRRGEARCTVRWQRGHQFDHDVPEHIEAHGDCAKFGCFHGEALTVRC